jgi:hypothetical protein
LSNEFEVVADVAAPPSARLGAIPKTTSTTGQPEPHESLSPGTAPKQLLGKNDEAIRALAQAEIADD